MTNPHRDPRSSTAAARTSRAVRRLARHYVAALILNVAVLNAPPTGRLANPPAIVRTTAPPRGRFDPRELSTPGVVITLPLAPRDQTHPSVRRPELN